MEDLTSQQRFELWQQFTERWPVDKLQSMTLEEYNYLGSKDSFCYWLESKTYPLGSIWGGSSYKFGIFEFDKNSKTADIVDVGAAKDDRYKWMLKYGSNANEAFEKVKSIICSIAIASSQGKFDEIDNIDLGHATKWKIAFLYQDKSNIKMPCVYLEDRIRAYSKFYDKNVPSSELYAKIMAQKDDNVDIFTLSQHIWQTCETKFENAWLLAPGENASHLEDFRKSNMIKIGWSETGDLTYYKNKIDLGKVVKEKSYEYEGKNPNYVVGMLLAFQKEMKVGDIVFLKNGTSEIVGRGIVKSEYNFLEEGEYKHAREFEFTHIGKWSLPSKCAVKSLSKLTATQCSQYENILANNETTPADTLNPQESSSKMTNKNEIPYSINTIFYGPPGTGKTHILLDNIAKKYFYEKGGQLTETERNEKIVAGLSWWEVIALCLLDSNDKSKVPAIVEHPLMIAHIKNVNNQRPSAAIWGQLQIHTKDECEHVNLNLSRRAAPKVFTKDQDSTWFIDRDIITQERDDLIELLKEYHLTTNTEEIIRYKFITFHQSYSYENFVEGISAETDDNGNITYSVKTGIFQEFCQKAINNPDKNYALFIDEINRGNVSGIFGELISLIEEDKRNNLHITLPYSKKDFVVPKNLYIFGSMNTADRSIDALDSALRRRFSFVEMPPQPELLITEDFKPNYLSIDLCKLLKSINRRVEFLLDRDHKIGHSYFMKIKAETKAAELSNLQKAFKDQIIPLLEDYFYGNLEKVQMVLGKKFIVADEECSELTSNCLMCGEDAIEFQDKVCLKVGDISTLKEEDFSELIK